MSVSLPETASTVPRLEPLEIHTGMVLGPRRAPAPDAIDRQPTEGPRQILERLLLEALQRPPCVVAFSGGRDSSAILAEATHVARKHGLEDPVPHTLRFGDAPRAAEDEWQELVIRHLGLESWSKRAVTDELDALGPIGRDVIRRHGVHWSPNIHTFELFFEPAVGGSLITGNGGDELFHPWAGHRVGLIRRGGALPRRRDVRPILRSVLPTPLLVQWVLRRPRFQVPWLRPDTAREFARSYATHSMPIPRNWERAAQVYLHSRYCEIVVAISQALARDSDVHLVEPFFAPEFVRAVVADAPPHGYGTRTEVVERYFGDRLPPKVSSRSTKAVFTEVFAGASVREFAERWDGSGVDTSAVDPEVLREQWLSPVPDLRTLVPLQAAWLAGENSAG